MQNGVADMSRVFAAGAVPSNATFPVTVPPFASSGVADPPAVPADALSADFGASVLFSPDPPQPVKASAAARPAPIQNFFIALRASFSVPY